MTRIYPFKICLYVGIAIGVLGIAYCTYIATRRVGDGVCGASAFLFIFGLPTTLLEVVIGNTGLVKGTWSQFIALSILFLVNWILWGTLVGVVVSKLLQKQ